MKKIAEFNTNKGNFKIELFINSLEDDLKKLVESIYLWDLEDILSDKKNLSSELTSVYERTKKDSTKRELKQIAEKIKIAELAKDTDEVQKLSERYSKLSQKLK